MKSKGRIKGEFKKYYLESILFELWDLKDNISLIEKAYTVTIAIEYCDPGPYNDNIIRIEKNILFYLIGLATDFCLNKSEEGNDFSTESNDIFYYLFNLITNQSSVSYESTMDFVRSFLLYEVIPNEIEDKDRFYFPYLFKKDKGYSIKQYLQTCFVAFAAIRSRGCFSDDYFIKASKIEKLPNFETMNSVLFDISASAIHYRRERKKINSLGLFRYQPILRYPLIKPWSNIPKTDKRKRYLVPLPNLIPHKANLGIYHHFLSKYKSEFTTYFGKEIFERYVKKTIDNCCYDEVALSEDQIRENYKIPDNIKMPDFIIIDNNRGIIVECKAAVLPLPVYVRGDVDDFRTTVKKLYTAVYQIANFEEYALNNSLYGVSEWIRLVVTYEPLWGINTTILSEILISDFMDEEKSDLFKNYFNQTIILSSSQLDFLQPHFSKYNTIFSILKRLKKEPFNEIYKSLIDDTGRSFEDSYLYKYFDHLMCNIE